MTFEQLPDIVCDPSRQVHGKKGMVSELIIGARGWQHPQWVTRFYPDDMPEEWQFSFYSNEFHAVLLPQAELLAADAAAVQDWHDDIADEFAFFIELDQLELWQSCLSRLEPVQSLIGGFVLRPESCTASSLAQCVPGLQGWAPVCVDERLAVTDDKVLRFVREHQLGCCWNVMHDTPAWREGELSVALLEGGFDYEPRRLRELLENCLRNTRSKPRRALFITGPGDRHSPSDREAKSQSEAPSIDTLRQAIQLRDLLE